MIYSLRFNLVALLLSTSIMVVADSKKLEKPAAPAVKPVIKSESDEVLIYKDGKPLFTTKDFENFLNDVKESDQRIGIMLEIQPESILKDMLESRERSNVISEWAKANNIRQTETYKDKKAKLDAHVHDMLDSEAFLDKHPVDLKDAEVRDYYNKNKEQMVARLGGIETVGIYFNEEAKALDFLQKVEKASGKDLAKVANNEKIGCDIEEFGAINPQSYAVDDAIKKAVADIKTFPAVKLVKVEAADCVKYWVIQAKEKRETEYMPFEEVSDRIKQMLQPAKVKDMLDARIPEYAKKYNIKKNDAAFDKLVKKFKDAASNNFAAMQQMEEASSK